MTKGLIKCEIWRNYISSRNCIRFHIWHTHMKKLTKCWIFLKAKLPHLRILIRRKKGSRHSNYGSFGWVSLKVEEEAANGGLFQLQNVGWALSPVASFSSSNGEFLKLKVCNWGFLFQWHETVATYSLMSVGIQLLWQSKVTWLIRTGSGGRSTGVFLIRNKNTTIKYVVLKRQPQESTPDKVLNVELKEYTTPQVFTSL